MPVERLAPDTVVLTNLTGTVADIQDDPDNATDTTWLVATANNVNTTAACTMPAPTDQLSAGPGLQEFRAKVRQNALTNSGVPMARLELWESGTLKVAGPDTNVTTLSTGVLIAFTWDAASLADITGAGVECRVVTTAAGGGPTARNSVDVGAVEWNADYSTATDPAPTDRSHFRDVTVDNTGGAAKTDWPVRIDLTAANFSFATAQADGGDVEMWLDTTRLAHWVEAWDAAAQTGTVWTKVPTLASGEVLTTRIYYGEPNAASTAAPDDVFSFADTFDSTTSLRGQLDEPDGIVLANRAGYPNPVLAVGAPGNWNDTEVREPSNVIYRPDGPAGEKYVVLYTGAGGFGNHVSAAFSEDGLTWTQSQTRLLDNAEDPYIVKKTDDTLWTAAGGWAYVYFERKDGSNTLGLARTKDFKVYETWTGSAWSANTAGHAALFPLGTAGAWDDAGHGSPCVLWDGTQLVMLYEGWTNTPSYVDATGVARSADGLTWTDEATNPITGVDVVDDVQLIGTTWWGTWHSTGGSQHRLKTAVAPASWSSTSWTSDGRAPIDAGNSIHPYPKNSPLLGMAMFMPNTTAPQAMHMFDLAGGADWRVHHQSGIANSSSPYSATLDVNGGRLAMAGLGGLAQTLRTKTTPLPAADFAILFRAKQVDAWQTVAFGQGDFIAGVPFPAVPSGYSLQDDGGVWKLREYNATAYQGDLTTLARDTDMTVDRRQEIRYRATGLLEYLVDGTIKLSVTNTTYVAGAKRLMVTQANDLASRDFQFIVVRKYDGVDPASTVGAEQVAPPAGGGSTTVAISAVGGGRVPIAKSGGAGTAVVVSAGGAGAAKRAGGTGTTIGVATAGAGTPARTGGAGANIGVSAAGAGTATVVVAKGGGASTTVGVAAAGAGSRWSTGGTGSTVAVSPAGAGKAARAGGAGATVAVNAAGAGTGTVSSIPGSGGASTIVGVSAAGAGSSQRAGGAGATVGVAAAGAGRAARAGRVTDLEVTVGARTISATVGARARAAELRPRTRSTVLEAQP